MTTKGYKGGLPMISKGCLVQFKARKPQRIYPVVSDSYNLSVDPLHVQQHVDILDDTGFIRKQIWCGVLEVISK